MLVCDLISKKVGLYFRKVHICLKVNTGLFLYMLQNITEVASVKYTFMLCRTVNFASLRKKKCKL